MWWYDNIYILYIYILPTSEFLFDVVHDPKFLELIFATIRFFKSVIEHRDLTQRASCDFNDNTNNF